MRFFFFFFSLFSFLCGAALEVKISAKSAILINADTGAVLFEKLPHLIHYPASTTKIATALYILEKEQEALQRFTKVSADCLKRKEPGAEPSWWMEHNAFVAGISRGEKFLLKDLLEGMLITSGDDVANALAEGVSGSVEAFVKNLNDYVASIGCKQTYFCNPHGLHHEKHISTASDLALLAKRAMRHPEFCEIVARKSWTKPASGKQPAQELSQTNRLLRPGRFFYDKATGMKTGFHSRAGYNLVASAELEGRKLIAVVLGCEVNDDRYHDTKRLFDAAFSEKQIHHTLLSGKESYTYQVEGAKKPLQAVLTSEVAIDYFPSEEPELVAKIHWDVPSLPILKGQKVGEIRIVDTKDLLIQTAPLCAQEEVKGTLFFVVKSSLIRLLGL